MKYFLALIMFWSVDFVLAQSVAPVPVAVSPAAPSVSPLANLQTPSPVPQPPEVVVEVLTKIESMPKIGMFVSKAIQIVAMIGSFMTLLGAFLIGLLKLLETVLSVANLTKAVDVINTLQNSKILYWIKYVSFLNAKKPAPVEPVP